MALSDITLKDYDTVVAVTQDAVNEGLADFLDGLQKQVALYYAMDNGNLVPVPEDQATVIFTGTLDYTIDDDGNPVDIVTLYTDGSNQTIAYNITFSNATFQVTPLGINVSQAAGGTWIIQFNVDLDLEPARIDDLPTNVQQAYQTYVNNLGPDAFSIQGGQRAEFQYRLGRIAGGELLLCVEPAGGELEQLGLQRDQYRVGELQHVLQHNGCGQHHHAFRKHHGERVDQ
jgi:hypothetical protein